MNPSSMQNPVFSLIISGHTVVEIEAPEAVSNGFNIWDFGGRYARSVSFK